MSKILEKCHWAIITASNKINEMIFFIEILKSKRNLKTYISYTYKYTILLTDLLIHSRWGLTVAVCRLIASHLENFVRWSFSVSGRRPEVEYSYRMGAVDPSENGSSLEPVRRRQPTHSHVRLKCISLTR